MIPLVVLLASACGPAPAADPTPVPATASPPSAASPTPVPDPSPTQTPACQETSGVSQVIDYPGRLLPGSVAVWTYRPPCAAWSPTPLPVLILLHGKPYDETHWPGLGLIDAYEAGLAADRWGPALLVAPHAPEPLFSSTDGGPNSYEQEFFEGLLPWLAAWAQEIGQPGPLVLAGISRGGVWALELGLRQPERFALVAGISPALSVNYARPAYDPFDLAQGVADLPGRIVLVAGEDDWARPHTERLAGLLDGRQTDLRLEIVPGNHSEATWSAALPLILAHLLTAG